MKKNSLFIIADDWSPIAKCYGNEVIQTPHIDRIAQRSLIFNNAFCTTPSCAASRANLLTGMHSHSNGQYGHTHGFHGFRTLSHVQTLPRILNENNFLTGCIGKFHTHPPEVYPWNFSREKSYFQPNDLTQDLTDFFTSNTNSQPFHLHVGLTTPHRDMKGNFHNNPHIVDYEYVRYDPKSVIVPDFLPDNEATRQDLAEYYTAISRHDHYIGLVLAKLEEFGHTENTTIYILSDHGMPFPGAKATSYDTGHRCPLIIADPELISSQKYTDELVSWTDIMPTILEGYGIEAPTHLEGTSFMDLIHGNSPKPRDETYFSHSFHGVCEHFPYRSIRTKQFKYTLNIFPDLMWPIPSDILISPTWKSIESNQLQDCGERKLADMLYQSQDCLYDIINDPLETTNLAENLEYQEILCTLKAKVNDFRERTNDPWLANTRSERFKEIWNRSIVV